jgi:hypothetical protein
MVIGSFPISSKAQVVDSEVLGNYRKIIGFIIADDAKSLSQCIQYPLHRDNPLPDIKTPTEFIRQYPILVDSSFKELLKAYSDSVVFEHHGVYGLVGGHKFNGQMWIDEDGKITALNYSSEREQKKKAALIEKQKKMMYPRVRDWEKNILVAKSGKYLIRVDGDDRTDSGFRYVSWSNGKTMKDEPDLILYNGKREFQGTMGGVTWTFWNKEWTYVVDDSEMGESDEYIGYFLYIYKGDQMKSRMRLTVVK